MLLSADSTACRELCSVPGYPNIGSPAFSPAGDLIALDGIAAGGQLADTEPLVVRADGTEPRVLGDGVMPIWSADGKRLAFSRNGGGGGVWVIDASGDPTTAEQVDPAGWGIQWSPDGNFWAYERAGRLVIRVVKTGKIVHQVRAADAPPVTWMWNFAWGPDSRSVCGVVRLPNGQEAVAVQKLDLPVAEALPDAAALGRDQIYECDPAQDGMPRAVPGQTPTANVDQGWSPDGTTLVYVAHVDFDF